MRRLLFFAAMLASGACRNAKPGAPPADRVVVETGARAAPRKGSAKRPAWFAAQLEAAERDEAEGRYRDAVERIDAALREAPDPESEAALRELKGTIHRHVLELPTLEGSIAAAREPIVFGQALPVVVRLENRSGRRVRIPAADKGTSASLLVFEVSRRDYDTQGQMVVTTRRAIRPIEREIDLPPGGVLEQTFLLAAAGNDMPIDGVRILTVSALLRPSHLEVGGVPRWDAIRVRAGRIRAFRANWEQLSGDPAGKLEQAIAKGAASHMLTACALLPWDRREEAMELLLRTLGRNAAFDLSLWNALELLTEAGIGQDSGAWRAWWESVRDGFFRPPADRPPPETPRFNR